MVPDFLQAWLVEGNVVAAMGYVSERSYACLAQDAPDPSAFDRGLAPFQILVNLKAAHDALGKRDSLEGLTIGVPLTIPGLRAVRHASSGPVRSLRSAGRHRGQVRLREPADAGRADEGIARVRPALWCDASASPGQRKDTSIALLWAKEDGYWKIVSWQTAPKPDETPVPPAPPEPKVVRIKADLTLVHAAKSFVDTWLIRKDYDAAFRYLSTSSYACYDLVRGS